MRVVMVPSNAAEPVPVLIPKRSGIAVSDSIPVVEQPVKSKSSESFFIGGVP